MTTAELLAMIRRRTGEVDLIVSDLTDAELLDVVRDAAVDLSVSGIVDLDDTTVGSDITEDGYGVSPEPANDVALLLTLWVSVSLLRAAYAGRLSRGELGISWTSGLESESTIQAGRAYRDAIAAMEQDLLEKKMLKLAPESGVRQQ